MRQNADGTWTVVRRITYTFENRPDLESQLARSRPVGIHPGGADGVYEVEDITEPALPLEMPEPVPGMIVEHLRVQDGALRRGLLTNCEMHGHHTALTVAGVYVRPDEVLRIWSTAGTLLWKRPTEPSPT